MKDILLEWRKYATETESESLQNLKTALQTIQNQANNLQDLLLEEKKKKSGDRCTRIAKRKYKVWPSAYASGAVVKCRQGKIWKGISENSTDEEIDELLLLEDIQLIEEKWSNKYKRSIDCNNPKGFSQRAHCQGRKKRVDEAVAKQRKIYILIGPPAVGKSSWMRRAFRNRKPFVINRDDIIEKQFQETRMSNYQMYNIPVPSNLKDGDINPQHPELGPVVSYEFGGKPRRGYKKALEASTNVNNTFANMVQEAIDKKYFTIVFDGLYSTPKQRTDMLNALSKLPNYRDYKKIAVFFEFKGYEEDIKKGSTQRALDLKNKFGEEFKREISDDQYEKIFASIVQPTLNEGFDEVKLVDIRGREVVPEDVGEEPEAEITEAKKRDYKPNFSKEKEQGLHGWFARNKGKGWINCRTGGPCGRSSADKKGGKYPACRPTKAQCKSAGKGPLRRKKSSKPISWTKKKKKD